jgi:hypothetical protein
VRPHLFVGRRKETAWIRAELEAGRSVVLTGIYGIGRTALARHVAEEMAREWHFVFADFDQAPGQVWRDLFGAVFPRAQERLRTEGRPATWMRYRVANRRLEDRRRHVVVLDNVARLTAPRLDAIRRLRERFQVVAIAEAFLTREAASALCSALWARRPLRLGYLGEAATVAFLGECSRHNGFGWGDGEILGLAGALHGFPLGMREAVALELRRRATVSDGRGLSPKEQ